VHGDLSLLRQPGVQDSGFGKALLDDYGLEIALRINRPAKVGEPLHLRCSAADTFTSEITFEETQTPLSMRPEVVIEDEGVEGDAAEEVSEVLEEEKEVLE
jgi:hypothetical protein